MEFQKALGYGQELLVYMEDYLNQLLDKFNEYKSIVNYRIEYTFEDVSAISFKLKQTDFPHLLGLHKLIDIPIIRQFNDKNNLVIGAKYINSRIKKQELLTENSIRRSIYFPEIEVRFSSFSKENILTMSYTDVVVDFNASLIGSNLKAKYVRIYDNIGVLYLEDVFQL